MNNKINRGCNGSIRLRFTWWQESNQLPYFLYFNFPFDFVNKYITILKFSFFLYESRKSLHHPETEREREKEREDEHLMICSNIPFLEKKNVPMSLVSL